MLTYADMSATLVPRPGCPQCSVYQLVVPPPEARGVVEGAQDWKEGGWNDFSVLQPDVYDVEQCAVTEYLVNRCKELKTRRAHLVLYVAGSTTPATTPASAANTHTHTHGALCAEAPSALLAQMQAFKLSGAAAMDFADTLSSAERARVHAAAEQVGLLHLSHRKHVCRHICMLTYADVC